MKKGLVHNKNFSRSIAAGAPAPEGSGENAPSRTVVYQEPEQDIRILGELVRDVGVQKDMLAGLVFSTADEYKRNLRVVRNAAERTIKRCDRLIGDEPPASWPST